MRNGSVLKIKIRGSTKARRSMSWSGASSSAVNSGNNPKTFNERASWRQGSVLEVFSNSRQNWYKGVVKRVNSDDTLTVQYEVENGDVQEKDLDRFDELLRPRGSAGPLSNGVTSRKASTHMESHQGGGRKRRTPSYVFESTQVEKITQKAAADPADTQLPEGWHKFTTSEGQTYYYNELTEETQWTKPTKNASDATIASLGLTPRSEVPKVAGGLLRSEPREGKKPQPAAKPKTAAAKPKTTTRRAAGAGTRARTTVKSTLRSTKVKAGPDKGPLGAKGKTGVKRRGLAASSRVRKLDATPRKTRPTGGTKASARGRGLAGRRRTSLSGRKVTGRR